MMIRIRAARRPRRGDDTGAALILVVGVGMILAMLMSMLVVVSVNGMRQARTDADWNAALAAAYAGIDEYQSRLAVDTTYYRFGNSAAPFSSGSSVVLPTSPVNPAFGVGTGGSWATVSDSDARAQYRYEVDNSKYSSTGRIRLRATGRVGAATRTIVADLKQQGFIDFLYFTDYEVQDPTVVGVPGSSCYTDAAKTVMKYSYEGRPMGTTCNEIAFGDSDVQEGPVHSNDTIRACGSTFTGAVTTADTRSPYYVRRDSNGTLCAAPTFTLTGYPAHTGNLPMPATNSELKKETRTDLAATDVPRPGCLYTGPTQITFRADGTMNVKSPFTKKTRIGNAAATSGSEPSACGAVADLTSVNGATIAVPENNVIYVQNVPSISTDVNYTAAGTWPKNFTCTTNSGWKLESGTVKSGYPQTTLSTSTTEKPPTTTTYGCRAGDVFVKGSFAGAATVAAENFIFVVGDLKYVDDQRDILGLVGNNAVWVWNPANAAGNLIDTSQNRRIDAAILSVAHTFQVQNYAVGSSRGQLTVNGAIAQKYRGVVRRGSAGFAKDYNYDTRFKYMAPPKFLNPTTTTYGVTTWVETSAAFSADGAAR